MRRPHRAQASSSGPWVAEHRHDRVADVFSTFPVALDLGRHAVKYVRLISDIASWSIALVSAVEPLGSRR